MTPKETAEKLRVALESDPYERVAFDWNRADLLALCEAAEQMAAALTMVSTTSGTEAIRQSALDHWRGKGD